MTTGRTGQGTAHPRRPLPSPMRFSTRATAGAGLLLVWGCTLSAPAPATAPPDTPSNTPLGIPLPPATRAGPDTTAPTAPAPETAPPPAAAPPALDTFTGSASYYADRFEGRTTASGRTFRQAEPWAAHRTLPGRVLDLSRSAARRLDFIADGHTRVRVEVLSRP